MTNFFASNNIIHGISAIKNVDEMGIYLDVDPRPLKKTPDDVDSLIGFGKIKEYATFTYDSVYDKENCKNMNVNIPDILGNDYKLFLEQSINFKIHFYLNLNSKTSYKGVIFYN